MFGSIVKKYNNYVRFQQTYKELSRLSERELNDLGIARADIGALARQASR
jgi:Uncharacterized conserved small protein